MKYLKRLWFTIITIAVGWFLLPIKIIREVWSGNYDEATWLP